MKDTPKNKITIVSRNEFEKAGVETKSKQFYFEDNRIHYENKLEITDNMQSRTIGLNVVNNLCKVHKNRLTKTTFVYFQDKVIKIQDQFYLQNSFQTVKVDSEIIRIKKPTHSKQPSNSENKNSSLVQKSQAQKKKKDLKNIVKNIVKIFTNWLDKYLQKQKCKTLMQELLISHQHKFNNSLVRAMSDIPEINKAFIIFLRTQSEELVTSSRIHDKKSHLQTLRRYQSIFENSQKNVGLPTSGNGSYEGNSSQNKNNSGSEDKDKFNMNESNSDKSNNSNAGEKMFSDPHHRMNENKGSSKGSDSDKLFNNSNSDNNRNRCLISSSNQENYSRGQRIPNRQNMIFFSSSGSDQ